MIFKSRGSSATSLISGSNEEKLEALRTLFAGNETGLKGVTELEYLLNYDPAPPGASAGPGASGLIVDLTLARGLNYYTGTIFEVKAIGVQMGSIGGGGRYDDLTGTFGVPNIPGVGVSFGVDRIYDVMEELKLFPEDVRSGTRVLFFNLGEAESRAAFGLLQQLRATGVAAELYHETAKFDKQFKYAEKKGIRFIVILGGEELASGNVKVKDLQSGQQNTFTFDQLLTTAFAELSAFL